MCTLSVRACARMARSCLNLLKCQSAVCRSATGRQCWHEMWPYVVWQGQPSHVHEGSNPFQCSPTQPSPAQACSTLSGHILSHNLTPWWSKRGWPYGMLFVKKWDRFWGHFLTTKTWSENDHAFASVCAGSHEWTCVFIFWPQFRGQFLTKNWGRFLTQKRLAGEILCDRKRTTVVSISVRSCVRKRTPVVLISGRSWRQNWSVLGSAFSAEIVLNWLALGSILVGLG